MMSKSRKVPAVSAVVLLLFMAFPLAAQIPAPVSNAKNATAGLFGNDVDNYMDYFGFKSVTFDSWFGYAGYQKNIELDRAGLGNLDEGNRFALGFAHRFKNFYLGSWYNGNVIELDTGSFYEKNPNKTDITGSSQADANNSDPSLLYADNQIQFLFGFKSFALKLGFQEELKSTSFTGPWTDGITTKDNDETSLNGYLAGDIGAGLPVSIGSLILKINLDARVFFYLDSVENISEYGGDLIRWGQHGDYIRPELNLALNLAIPGDYDDVFTPGITYAFSARIYNNKYDVNGITGDVTGIVHWREPDSANNVAGSVSNTAFNRADIAVSEYPGGFSELTHIITPQFQYSKNLGDRLKLGVFAKVPVLIASDSYKSYQEITEVNNSTQKVIVEYMDPSETTISNLEISPELDFGISFQAIPGRLNLNVGFIAAFKYHNYVKETEPSGSSRRTEDGIVIPQFSRAKTESYYSQGWDFSSPFGVRAGFTLNFTPRFMLDAYFSPKEPSEQSGAAIETAVFSLLFSLKR
jgi:hypothetical protein